MKEKVIDKVIEETGNKDTEIIKNVEPSETAEASEDYEKEDTQVDLKTGKTFTQKELDEIIKQRLSRERDNLKKDEKYKAFEKWQEEQKTEIEKNEERIKALAEKESEIQKLQYENIILSKGITGEKLDYALFLSQKEMKTNPSDNFNEVVDRIIKENGIFAKTETINVSTGAIISNNDSETKKFTSLNEALADKYKKN